MFPSVFGQKAAGSMNLDAAFLYTGLDSIFLIRIIKLSSLMSYFNILRENKNNE